MNPLKQIILPAPAKINMHLHITGILDHGMHELDTSFVFTEACDKLSFSPARHIQVSCSSNHLSGEQNLVHRLLSAFRDHVSVQQGLHIHIDKILPEQAGLGGGSSDAATALLFANHLWGCQLNRQALIEFSAPFGADIPCFLYGKASLASGIGEKLIDYPEALPTGTLLMAWPGTGLSTAEMFRHFDANLPAGHPNALTPSETVDTMRRDPANLGQNDLESSACELNPQVKELLQCLRQSGRLAWMSGSGSTCVALFDSQPEADDMALQLKASGLAGWTHTGRLVRTHPVGERLIQDGLENWDVAKR